MKTMIKLILIIIVLIIVVFNLAAGEDLDKFACTTTFSPAASPVVTNGQFNGYTNYWQSAYWKWSQYGNLFLVSQTDVERSIAQNKVDTAEELGIPGLSLAEGFLEAWLKGPVAELEDPDPAVVEKALDRGNVLVWVKAAGPLGKKLLGKLPGPPSLGNSLASHQRNARDYHDALAFALGSGERRLFAVVTDCAECRGRFRDLLTDLRTVVGRYDLHRGWFGTGTLLHSVTCHPGHPLEVIGQGLGQGNDWFTFSGYMDYLMRSELAGWLGKVGLDLAVDVGTGKATHSLGTVAYGLGNYDGLKIQDMPTEEEWIRFVKSRDGYIFRPIFAAGCDKYTYDGVIGIDGNKKQVDEGAEPFILQTGLIKEEAPASMVLFAAKGRRLTRREMWRAILERRAVGILPQGRMMGPAFLRNALQMLLLDRVYLENLFADRVRLDASWEGYELRVRLVNLGDSPLAGTLEVRPAPELAVDGKLTEVSLPPGTERSFSFAVRPSAMAMAKANPVLVEMRWQGSRKRTLAVLDLPPAVSVHKLLHGQAPEVVYPVSIHNFTAISDYPVEVKVYAKGSPKEPVYETSRPGTARTGDHQEMEFRLPLKPGSYTVKVAALGASNETQLGVGLAAGKVMVSAIDLNADGIKEYRLENDKVRVTLLAIGARVIEYIVKEKNDNILFKLWPERESTDKRPFRERGFYPYGGFEDFLGQASIETHKVYEAEVIQAGGTSASVRMSADYYGNRLEKTFTLDGDSPLLEVRFALEFRNPELNMLGPQPILALGEKHWTEDVFVVPAMSGLREVRMRPEEYFGEVFFLKEGWNAGRDTVEDVSFVGAFPVSEPEFLHVWMNHPSNGESQHYYAEFQPWVPIFQKTVRYFSYYLWGAAGPWEKGLEELRRRNLITSR
ncbi:MAG: hypothetical protein NT147_03870 [Candidatus Aminicenantes bacterium]|nr:hypothetical protein [Candidatus Aminicenantes bacterium]